MVELRNDIDQRLDIYWTDQPGVTEAERSYRPVDATSCSNKPLLGIVLDASAAIPSIN